MRQPKRSTAELHRQAAILICIGLTNIHIGEILFVSEKTVINWRQQMRLLSGSRSVFSVCVDMIISGQISVEEIKEAKKLHQCKLN